MKKFIILIILMLIPVTGSALDIDEVKRKVRNNWYAQEKLSEAKRAQLMEEANYVVEGQFIKGKEAVKNDFPVDVVEQTDESLHFITYFKVNREVKGELFKSEISIAVHSPTIAFGFTPMEYGAGSEILYRIYLKSKTDGNFVMIGREFVK